MLLKTVLQSCLLVELSVAKTRPTLEYSYSIVHYRIPHGIGRTILAASDEDTGRISLSVMLLP